MRRRTATAAILGVTALAALLTGCSTTNRSPATAGSSASGPAASGPAGPTVRAAGSPSGSSSAGAAGAAETGSPCPGRPPGTRYVALVGHDTAADAVELVLRAGRYVCGDPADPDAARFAVTGPARTLVVREDARITATAPVAGGSAGMRISLSELIDWLGAHQGALAVFTCATDPQGRISALDEVDNG